MTATTPPQDEKEPDAHRHPGGGRARGGPQRREVLIRAKATELAAAGATVVREETYSDQFGHMVMLDPEGNEFCVA